MKEIMDRFVDWVNKHGGPTPVAVAIGKSPQSFYNYTNRGSKPNMEIFALLANKFEDFDPAEILTGASKSQPTDAEAKLKLLESKYQILQSMYEEVSFQKKQLSPGKFKGAILCPDLDRETRKHQFKDTMKSLRGKWNSKSISVRVQEVKVPSLSDLSGK